MKVKELIEQLKDYDDELEVQYCTGVSYWSVTETDTETGPDGDLIVVLNGVKDE